jgi:membrane-bound inhibitor of C-type lysozyme
MAATPRVSIALEETPNHSVVIPDAANDATPQRGRATGTGVASVAGPPKENPMFARMSVVLPVVALFAAALAVSACNRSGTGSASDVPVSDSTRAKTTPAGTRVKAGFACGATRLNVTFSTEPDEARVEVDGAAAVALLGQRPASGIWYAGNGYELRGKGRDATWTAPGQPPLQCTQDG